MAAPEHRAPLPDAVRDLGSETLVIDARELAHRLIGGLGRRWSHTEGVARRAASVAASVPDADRSVLVAAAWLHDIGYAEPLKRCAFHPLDGAFYLQAADWGAPVPGLVAHHSGARFVAAVRGLGHLMRHFDALAYTVGPLADALAYADQTTGPDGRPMAVEDRFTDMLTRHGPHSPQAQVHTARAPAIRAAVRRTEQRLRDARTGTHPSGHEWSTVSP
ncbi:HD domain-containing protein [Modestobacter marinus]|uniref:HD domain-containing protein n=1 Tax=Modestobacter marinus TaxID=477641 RepID=UPI001C9850B2|nr:HD domain-containing protein [Modestobacter marinus]